MQALSFLVVAVVVALTAWIFFDATERGKKAPWLWALGFLLSIGTVVGWAVVLIAYAANRNEGHRVEVARGSALRLYFAVTSFSSFFLMVTGAATAVTAALAYAVSTSYSSSDFRDLAASAVSAFVVGAVVWVPHWRAMRRRLAGSQEDADFRALFVLRRTETLTAAFVFGVVAMASALVTMGGGISALFHAWQADKTIWLPPLGVLLASGLASLFSAVAYRRTRGSEAEARYLAVPAPKVVPRQRMIPSVPPMAPAAVPPPPPFAPPAFAAPPSPPRPVATVPAPPPAPTDETSAAFCGHCGTKLVAGDAFCRACGAAASGPDGRTSPPSRAAAS
ncbi:MAG: zinc ribbon domain-containing protein [Acidobacteriota bacterium]|nr:zinc ribbon domain-containing protein [Acidobacteriota bacterium]